MEIPEIKSLCGSHPPISNVMLLFYCRSDISLPPVREEFPASFSVSDTDGSLLGCSRSPVFSQQLDS